MEKKFIQNSFRKGMVQDSHPIDQPENTYTFSLNVANKDVDQQTTNTNHYGNNLCVEFDAPIVGGANILELNGHIIFLENGEIHFFNEDTCESEFIASDKEFGCDWKLDRCDSIIAHINTINDCNEIYIYWSSGCEYRWINYSELADPERKAGLKKHIEADQSGDKCGVRSCDYFNVFNKVCSPVIRAESRDDGGSLSAGAYYVNFRLKDSQGGITNFFNFTDVVYVGSEHNSSGEQAFGLLEIDFSELDCDFNSMDIAVVSVVNGTKSARLISNIYYTNENHSYTYTGVEGIEVPITQLLVNGKTYLQGKNQVIKDNIMWYYNVRQRKNPDLQRKILENVTVNTVGYKVRYSQVKENDLKSLMGGETYALSIVYNSADHLHTRSFHVGAASCSTGNNSPQSAIPQPVTVQGQPPSFPTATSLGVQTEGNRDEIFVRNRQPAENSFENPQQDELGDQLDIVLDNWDTDLDSIIEGIEGCFCETPDGSLDYTGTDSGGNPVNINANIPGEKDCEECINTGEIINRDKPEVNRLVAAFQDLLASYGVDENLTVNFTSTNILEGARALRNAVKNRQRVHRNSFREFIRNTTPEYYQQATQNTDSGNSLQPQSTTHFSPFSTSYHDEDGNPINDLDVEVVYRKPSIPNYERDIKYPLTTNCEGEFVYGECAGSNVAHHKIVDRDVVSHFEAHSAGVPSQSNSGSNGEDEAFVTLLGVELLNIPIPTKEELGFEVCKKNPYTVAYIKRTKANKNVLMKGIGTKTYESENAGKRMIYPRHALNSAQTVDRYINKVGETFYRREKEPRETNSINFWSLDGLTKKPSLRFDTVSLLQEVWGPGERYGHYKEGSTIDDALHGKRVDNLGTRQAIHLSNWSQTSGGAFDYEADFKTYAPPNSIVAPPISTSGQELALMNKYRQESIWIGIQSGYQSLVGLPPFSYTDNGVFDADYSNQPYDLSFQGDGLEHRAILPFGAAHYLGLKRDLPNQYGSLVNASYIPLFQSGPQHFTEEGGFSNIQAICGDVYVGATSFVRTGYISDKVGSCNGDEKYTVVGEQKCICDPPYPPNNSAIGNWAWPELPEHQDKWDPKNYCNLHTNTALNQTNNSEQAIRATAQNNLSDKIDHYYPRTLKTLIIYWGEFETCPWRREISDEVRNQVYPYMKEPFDLDTSIGEITDWNDGLLHQFYYEQEQPSTWQKNKKIALRSLIQIVGPLLGIGSLASSDSGLDILTGLAGATVLVELWDVLNQDLFDNKKVDKMVGIPPCPSDNTPYYSDEHITKFFLNYHKYNHDYSEVNDIKKYYGIPDPYYTCDCDDCTGENETVNEIYPSDKRNLDSDIDAFKRVRPNNVMKLPADKGSLVELFEESGGFYANTTNALYQLQYNQTSIPSTEGNLIMGRGDILSDPVPIMSEANEGSFGLQHITHSISSAYGRFFVDLKAKRVFHMIGGKPQDITPGMYNFFREFLGFCETKDCHNQLISNSTGLSLGLDPRLGYFHITKRDGDTSWTLTYDIMEKVWVSFNSFIPNMYLWNRLNMFTVKDNEIWKHDNYSNPANYYGKQYPVIIEFPNSERDLYSQQITSLIIQTFAQVRKEGKFNIERVKKTFDKLWVYNTYQSSGSLNLIPTSNADRENAIEKITEDMSNKSIINEYGQWRVNGIYDMKNDSNIPHIGSDGECSPFTYPINDGHNKISEGYFENRIIEDVYNMIRLELTPEQGEGLKLYIRALVSIANKNSQ